MFYHHLYIEVCALGLPLPPWQHHWLNTVCWIEYLIYLYFSMYLKFYSSVFRWRPLEVIFLVSPWQQLVCDFNKSITAFIPNSLPDWLSVSSSLIRFKPPPSFYCRPQFYCSKLLQNSFLDKRHKTMKFNVSHLVSLISHSFSNPYCSQL